TATPPTAVSTGIVATTVSVAVSITFTLGLPPAWDPTYAKGVAGAGAAATATAMAASSASVRADIADLPLCRTSMIPRVAGRRIGTVPKPQLVNERSRIEGPPSAVESSRDPLTDASSTFSILTRNEGTFVPYDHMSHTGRRGSGV